MLISQNWSLPYTSFHYEEFFSAKKEKIEKTDFKGKSNPLILNGIFDT